MNRFQDFRTIARTQSTALRFAFPVVALLGVLTVGTPAWAASLKVGAFSKSTSTGNQVVAHGLGETPKALIFWTAGKFASTASADYQLSFGMTDGTTSYSVSTASQNAIATNSSRRINGVPITIVQWGEVLTNEAAFVSWDVTNFTLNWTTNNGANMIIGFMAIGGADVSAKMVNWTMGTATGNVAVTGVGFEPDVVIHAHAAHDYVTVGSNLANAGFGVGVMEKAGYQWASMFYGLDGAGTSDTRRSQRTDYCFHLYDNAGVLQKRARYVSMDSDGFTVNFDNTTSTAASQVVSLALKGVASRVGNFSKSTGGAPASQSIGSVGFTPDIVLLASFQNTAGTTSVANACFGLGASDATNEGSASIADTDARNATPVAWGIAKATKVFIKMNNNAGNVDAEADLTSMDEDGFTLNWSANDAVATEMLYLALGSGPVPSAPPLLAYSEDSARVQNYVYWRRYATDHWTGWGPAAKDPNFQGTTIYAQQHKVVRTNPAFSKQAIVWKNHNVNYTRDDLMAVIWDGTNWDDGNGSPFGDTRDFGRDPYQFAGRRTFDAAFMQQSGRLLVASDCNVQESFDFWVWNGSNAWETGAGYCRSNFLQYSTGELINWYEMSARPGTNEIAVIASLATNTYTVASVRVAVWKGDTGTTNCTLYGGGTVTGSWSDQARFVNSTSVRYQTEAVAIQYVLGGTHAGDAVAVWGEGQYVYSRTYQPPGSWTGSTVTVADLGAGNTVKWLKLKPRPGGDDLILAIGGTVSSNSTLYTIPYDGDSQMWGTLSTAHSTTLYGDSNYNRPFDVLWDPGSGGSNVLLVYSDTGRLRYRTSSDRGTTWGPEQDVSTSYQAYWVQLERPAEYEPTVHLAIHDQADDLRTWTWASATWTYENLITTDLEQGPNGFRESEVFRVMNKINGGTTAVKIADFKAGGYDSTVLVEWETGSEMDNLGFHLYRATTAEGPYARITSTLIPGLGSSPEGGSYEYRDTGLTNGVTYYYKLEDVETTGKTTLHGPVSATPLAGVGDEGVADERSPNEDEVVSVGDPTSSELRVVERGLNGLVLELRTGGFYAEPQDDGTVELRIPGFDTTAEVGLPSLPVRRTWVEALVGRNVEVVSARAFDEETFTEFRPGLTGEPIVEVSRRGSVRASQGRDGRPRLARPSELYPSESARVLSVGFQEDVKKALVEMAPLRWDGSRLMLAHRLVIHVRFYGRDTADTAEAGARGRRYRRRTSHADRRVVARFVTEDKGLYGVPFEEVFGRGNGRSFASSSLRVSRQGEPVRFCVLSDPETFGPGATLYFLGEGAETNIYGNEAVYELEVGAAGEPMPVVSTPPSGSPVGFYRRRVEKEENLLYQATLMEAPDIWLWSMLFAPVTKSFVFEADALAAVAEPSRLTVWLQGATDFAADPDHHVRVFVNGSFVGETSWNGKAPRTLELDVLPGILREGENILGIENVGDTAASSSMVILNRFSVDYPRLPLAEVGRLEGRWSESGSAEVAGLASNAHLLRLDPEGPVWLTGAQEVANGLRFGVEADNDYLMVAPEAVLRVREVRKPLPGVLKNIRNAADYVVIGPRDLLDAASPLLEHRREQGLGTLAVDFEQVVSEFGFGEPTPEAIRDFLSFAYHQWRQPPRYVLLLGDTSFDFKDYLHAPVKSRLPSLTMKTPYLWTVSDPSLAAVNGEDLLPDLAIGRLPAADVSELRAMVDKILAYETSGQSPEDRIVLVADNPDVAGNFDADADALAAGALRGFDVTKIYLSRLGPTAARASIQQAFNDGSSLMSYIGHGAIHLWADENLFNIDTVRTLHPQAQQSILLTMNCLNGYFQFPFFDSVAEALLQAPEKGSVAAFSPSGLSLNGPAHVYHEALLQQLLHGGHRRLGDAVLAAQVDYARAGALPDMLAIYHLFGDPALALP